MSRWGRHHAKIRGALAAGMAFLSYGMTGSMRAYWMIG